MNPKTAAVVCTRWLFCSPLLIMASMPSSLAAFSPPTATGFRSFAIAHAPGVTAGDRSSRFAPAPLSLRPLVALGTKAERTEHDSDATIITPTGVDRVFGAVDVDGSGAIDLAEYNAQLSSAGYSEDTIRQSFADMDRDGNGSISRDEFRSAIASLEGPSDCTMGYWYDSVQQTCQQLGPLGRLSQRLENLGPFKTVYKKITNLFGVDKQAIRSKGVSFFLTYSILSNLNGALSLTFAWYLTVKRTGVSPLVPGQKTALLTSYAMIYGALQILKPFRVAAAIAMSKLSAEYLVMTEDKLKCSRNVAIGCQYAMGQLMMGVTFLVGVTVVSLLTGVPLRG